MRFPAAFLITLCLASPALAGAGQPRDEETGREGGRMEQQRPGQVSSVDRVRAHVMRARSAIVLNNFDEARRELDQAERSLDQAARTNEDLRNQAQDIRKELSDIRRGIQSRDMRVEKDLQDIEGRLERYSPQR